MKNKNLVLIKALIRDNFFSYRFAKNKWLLATMLVLLLPGLLISMGSYYWLLCDAFQAIGRLDIVLALCFLAGNSVCIFMSLYKAPGFLFSFKDYDMLMAMPLGQKTILLGKLFIFYLNNLLTVAVISFPGIVVYGVFAKSRAGYYLASTALMLFIPVMPMIGGSILAFAVNGLSRKFRRSNLVSMALSMALLIAIIMGSQMLSGASQEKLSGGLTTIDKTVRSYPIAQWFVDALVFGKITAYALFTAVQALCLFAFVTAFAGLFRSLNALMGEHQSGKDFKMTGLKTSSPIIALYKKELKFYFSINVYVLNTAIGIVLLTVYSVAFLVFGSEMLAEFIQYPNAAQYAVPIMFIMAACCTSITCTTAPSISLEGSQLWILKTLPVKFSQIALAKILLNLTIIYPFIPINTAIAAIALKLAPIEWASLGLVMVAYGILAPIVGLLCNLMFPKLEWKAHVQAVKQSMSVVAALLVNTLAVALPCVVYMFVKPKSLPWFALITAGLVLLAALVLWQVINTKGRELYDGLLN